ncbi:MAG: lysophospholipase [Promethearchaeota archaeon]
MKLEEGKFDGVVGSPLFYNVWLPEGDVKATVQLLHGYAEYSGRYERVADALVKAGFAVYGHDQVGHGKSEGIPGFLNTFDDLVDDAKNLRDLMMENHPGWDGKPKFILGHSMGSIVVVRYLDKHPGDFDGVILSGFGWKVEDFESMSPLLKGFAKFITKIVKKARMKYVLNSAVITSDPVEAERYLNDPLLMRKPAIKLGIEWMKVQPTIPDLARKIQHPILLQRGEKDNVMLLTKEEAESSFTAEDQTIKIYEGALHECYNEIEEIRMQAIKDLVDWLEKHV